MRAGDDNRTMNVFHLTVNVVYASCEINGDGRGCRGGGGISTTRTVPLLTVRVPGLYLLTVLTARYRVRVLYEYCTPVRLNTSTPQQGEVYNPGPDVRRDRDYLVPVYVETGIITIERDKWSRGPGRGGATGGSL